MPYPQDQEQQQPLTSDSNLTPLPEDLAAPPNSFHQFQQRAPALRNRPGYARVPSVSFADERHSQQAGLPDEEPSLESRDRASSHGLGIALPLQHASVESIDIQPARKHGTPADIFIPSNPPTPGSAKPLMSPPSTGGMSGSTKYDSPYSDWDTSYASAKLPSKQSHVSLQSSVQPSIYANSEAGLLSIRSRYDSFAPQHQCVSTTNFKRPRLNWISITIMVFAVYSTVMSALFLVVAVRGPRYGRMIRTNSTLTISGATVLTTFFAKTIELTFVTVIVALLGQALARRAHDKKIERGITLAEINMRSWILQPGTLFTHWESVRYAGVTLLGFVSLLAAILALLYVTAANALVQPQLKFNSPQRYVMQGLVKTSFANPKYIARDCQTPIPWASVDQTDGGTTCLQLEHAAMAFHNYHAYLGTWSDLSKNGNGTGDLNSRPKGYAMLNDNTTITAPWIEQENGNMTKLYEDHGHIVINVSMAMPHAGVVGAAMDPINKIMQPEDLDGQGLYRIRASVPSPVVHVLCAMLTKEDMDPYVLQTNLTTNEVSLPSPYNLSDPFLGGTPLDKLFSWGPAYGDYTWPPVFGKLPIGYNTIVNDTLHLPYGRDAIYLLGNSTIEKTPGAYLMDPPVDTFVYPLCKITVNQTPYCSTWYNASNAGAAMEAVCEDRNDDLAYKVSLTNATSGNFSLNREWPNIAGEWIRSIALNNGIVDSNGSNSRVLNQLVPKKAVLGETGPSLDPALPSIAEALAVMAGCTLLQSTKDAPFVQFFNYTPPDNILSPGQYQYFNASIEAQQYASGGTAKYQRAFIVVLFAVFILNLVALVYFLTHRDWYADLSEPSNLFSLAINSPPSKELAGSCGGGPHGEQYRSSWKLQDDGGHVYMESMEKKVDSESPSVRRRRRLSEGFDIMMSPVRKTTRSMSEIMSR